MKRWCRRCPRPATLRMLYLVDGTHLYASFYCEECYEYRRREYGYPVSWSTEKL